MREFMVSAGSHAIWERLLVEALHHDAVVQEEGRDVDASADSSLARGESASGVHFPDAAGVGAVIKWCEKVSRGRFGDFRDRFLTYSMLEWALERLLEF